MTALAHTPQPRPVRDAVLSYLAFQHAPLFRFWTQGADVDATVEQHCDLVYALHLVDALDLVHSDSPAAFARLLGDRALPGWRSDGPLAPALSVHNTAYAFGTLNLLARPGHDLYALALEGRTFHLADIADAASGRPRYPRRFTHHSWRVSHWLGGVPSLLLSVARSGTSAGGVNEAEAARVLDAANGCLAPATGLIKLYAVEPLQQLFRLLYGVRHDPALGDLGGVAHVLWVNHATGRPYVAAAEVLERASRLFQAKRPFMEAVPYCLDFDIVQIVRTALDQTGADGAAVRARALEMSQDLEAFLMTGLSSGYSLHKLPGALATHHECAMLAGLPEVAGLGIAPRDIIKDAYWL